MSKHLGNYAEDFADLNTKFTTVDTSGVPATLGGTPAISCYKSNGLTQSTAGITLTADFDSVTGLNNVNVDLSADAFYATGEDYQLVITTGTVGGSSVVGYVIAEFSIEARYTRGTDSAATAASLATAQTDLDTITGADGVTLATTQGNYAPSTAAALSTAQADLDTLTGSDGATLATTQANYAPATAAALSTAQTDLDTLTGTDGATLATAQGNYAPAKAADILTTALTEAYAADGAAPTLTQAIFLIQQALTEFSNSGTTKTIKKLDGLTTAATETYDDADAPTSITRAT